MEFGWSGASYDGSDGVRVLEFDFELNFELNLEFEFESLIFISVASVLRSLE